MLTNIYVSVDGATKVLAEQGVEFKAGEDTVKKVSFELDYVDAKIKKPFSTIKFFIYQNFNVDWLNYVIYPATLTYTVNGTKSITSMYPSGETIPRSSVNSFTWKTTTPGVITSNKLYYKKSSETSYTIITLSNTAQSYKFAKSTFTNGDYQWYVAVKDSWGSSFKSDVKKYKVGAVPTVSFLSIASTWRLKAATTISWKYSDPLGFSQAVAKLGYRVQSGTWKYINLTNGETSYKFASGTFTKVGKYDISIRVKNSDGAWSETKTQTVQIGTVPTLKIASPTTNTIWHVTKDNNISWSWSDALGLKQKTYELQYKPTVSGTWQKVTATSTATSYKFLKNTLTRQSYDFRVRACNADDVYSEWSTVTIQVGSVPTLSMTYPNANDTILRTQANTFTWNYTDKTGFLQTAYEISYKLTSSIEWTTITKNTANQYHVFSASYFEFSKYNFKIRVKNDDGNWSEYKSFNVQVGSVPTVSILNPENNAVLHRNIDNAFEWKVTDSLDLGQKAYELRYRMVTDIEWTVIAQEASATSYILRANSLDYNNYVWQVRVQNIDDNWSAWSAERKFEYGTLSVINLIYPADGDNVRLVEPLTVQWETTNKNDVPQKAYSLEYKVSSAEEWTTITGTTGTSRSIPSEALTHDHYDLRLKIQNADNVWTDYVYFSVLVGIEPSLTASFPVDINIKKDIEQTFTWEVVESTHTGQHSFILGYRKKGDANWTDITQTTADQYYSFAPNTFDAGEYEYRLQITNNDGITTDYTYVSFYVIGVTDAPVLDSVTQSSIPILSWTVTSQDTFEIEIFKEGICVYSSGIQKGYNVRSFRPNIMLPDGKYNINMRCMNEYGFFTEWMSYSFILDTVKPKAYDCFVFANGEHGVTVNKTDFIESDNVIEPDNIYVIRRRYGESDWQIIGKISDDTASYSDREPEKNVEYEYALRSFNSTAGYTDSDPHKIMLKYDGVLIYSGNEYINLTLSETQQFNISHAPAKNMTYIHAVGRVFPIQESSDWMEFNTNFKCYVTYKQFEILYKFMSSGSPLWFKGKDFSYACSIKSMSIVAAHLDRGYDISISLTRIDDEEIELL